MGSVRTIERADAYTSTNTAFSANGQALLAFPELLSRDGDEEPGRDRELAEERGGSKGSYSDGTYSDQEFSADEGETGGSTPASQRSREACYALRQTDGSAE